MASSAVVDPSNFPLALHPYTLAALGDVVTLEDINFDLSSIKDDVTKVIIYTDGSGGQLSTPSWAFCILLECWFEEEQDHVWVLAGYYSGLVVSADPEADVSSLPYGWCGSTGLSPFHAEASALVWAIAWLSVCPFDVPFELRPDNLASLNIASRAWSTSGLGHLGVVLREFYRVLSFRHSPAMTHVAGHTGDPWNELADRIAAATSLGLCGSLDLPWLAPCCRSLVPHWTFVRYAGSIGLSHFPPVFEESLLFGSHLTQLPDLTYDPTKVFAHQCLRPLPATSSRACFPFAVASFNIQSLLDPTDLADLHDCQSALHLDSSSRVSLCHAQFLAQGLFIVGLQETRTSGVGLLDAPGFPYFRFRSGCADGLFGAELWFCKARAYATLHGIDYYLHPKHVTLIDASPRHLFVRLQAPFLNFFVLCAHAPHSQYVPSELDAWWNSLSALVQPYRGAAPLMVLIDANARVGSIQTSHIGGCKSDVESPTGALLHTFLAQAGLWLPSTFHLNCGDAGTLCPDSGTWKDHAGGWHRLDFVGLSFDFPGLVTSHFVWPDFDRGIVLEDHRPVVVTLDFPLSTFALGKLDFQRHRSCKLPQSPTQSHLDAFDQAVRSLGPFEWTVEAHCHFENMQQRIYDSAVSTSKANRPRRSPAIDDFAWDFLCLRKRVKSHLVSLTRRCDRMCLLWFFILGSSSVCRMLGQLRSQLS